MEEDIANWRDLSNADRSIIAGILRGFTQIECIIGEYWSTHITKMFPKPEINAMACAFSFFESIHAFSYRHLSDTLDLKEEKEYYNDPLAQQKVEYLLNNFSDKVKIAVFSGAAEGVALFAAFSILLSYNLDGRFKGLSQIISWSLQDEAPVVGTASFLTPYGWKQIQDYEEGDLVAQFNPETKEIDFVKPLDYIIKETDSLIHINKEYRVSQYLSPNHTVIDYKNDSNIIRKTTAKDWHPRQSYLPVSGFLNSREINDYDRFSIALQANGSISPKPSLREVIFSFKNERKIKRLITILNNINFPYKTRPTSDGYVNFLVLIPDKYLYLRTKNFYDVYTFDNIPNGFIEELGHWDGHFSKGTDSITYTSKSLDLVKFVQTAASLQGYYGHVAYQDKTFRNYSIYLKHRTTVCARYFNKDFISLNSPEKVYCFKLPSKAFLIKQDGLISITGNCHAEAGIDLYNTLIKEKGNPTSEEISAIIEGFDTVLSNEINFLNNVFKDVDNINGFTLYDFIQYITYRANQRINSLAGVTHNYPYDEKSAAKIAEWMDPFISGATSNDFFAHEKDGSQYIARPNIKVEDINIDKILKYIHDHSPNNSIKPKLPRTILQSYQ